MDRLAGRGVWLAAALFLCAGAALCAGCEEQGIRVYQAPKDPPRREAAAPHATPAPTAPHATIELTWTAPPQWQPASEPRPMRLATYFAGEDDAALEIAVSAFPGDVGGVLANINRWRGQLGVEPLGEHDWRDHVEPFGEPGGVHGWTLRIDAPSPDNELEAEGMIAAIVHVSGADRTWFVRAVGDTASLDAHEADVIAFARTFEVEGED